MATESIFTNFDITTEEKAKAFIAALEASERWNKKHPFVPNPECRYVTDPKEISRLCRRYRDNGHK
ncbi:MAG: hypothetical protein J5746_06520 [Victivallales bacterium]|nr:hypothetical protein [Victivallales bacterium]